MSADRIEILSAWQDAERIEREALVDVRERILTFLKECDAGEYPRLTALNAHIRAVDDAIIRRGTRIADLREKADASGADPTRLTTLLRRQEDARDDRAALVDAREAIQVAADDAGQKDLTSEQDERYAALTREIAEVDNEIVARAQEIETLAALSAVGV